MSDLISRDDAIRELSGACSNWEDDAKVQEIVMAIPSADAVPLCDDCTRCTVNALNRPSAEAVQAQAEKCDECIHKGTHKDKMTCKECVSAEAVQGEWIEKGGELVCSVCGNSVSFSRTPKGWVLGRFCQTCGAKMTKGGGSE